MVSSEQPRCRCGTLQRRLRVRVGGRCAGGCVSDAPVRLAVRIPGNRRARLCMAYGLAGFVSAAFAESLAEPGRAATPSGIRRERTAGNCEKKKPLVQDFGSAALLE